MVLPVSAAHLAPKLDEVSLFETEIFVTSGLATSAQRDVLDPVDMAGLWLRWQAFHSLRPLPLQQRDEEGNWQVVNPLGELS